MQNQKSFVQLEALRGLAAVIVLFHHFMLGFTPRLHGLLYPDQAWSLMGTPAFALVNGSAAVIVFFVLSGFVLSLGVLRSPKLSKAALSIIKRWPRLAGTVVLANVTAGTLVAFGEMQNISTSKIVPSIWLGYFYTSQNRGLEDIARSAWEGLTTFFVGTAYFNSNLWTMYYEFWGSILAIACAAICIRLQRPQSRVVILCITWALSFYISAYFSTFLVGVGLAVLYLNKPTLMLSNKTAVVMAFVAIMLLGFNENLVSGRAEGAYRFLEPLVERDALRTRIIVHTVAAALLLAMFLWVASIRIAVSGRAGRLLGIMSFPIYLAQILVICTISSNVYPKMFGAGHLTQVAVTFFVTVVGTLVLALPIAVFDQWWVKNLNRLMENLYRLAINRAGPCFRHETHSRDLLTHDRSSRN